MKFTYRVKAKTNAGHLEKHCHQKENKPFFHSSYTDPAASVNVIKNCEKENHVEECYV